MRKLVIPENQKFTFFSNFWRELSKLEKTKISYTFRNKEAKFSKIFYNYKCFFLILCFFSIPNQFIFFIF